MAVDIPREDAQFGARIVHSEFLPAALAAAHRRLTSGHASAVDIQSSIAPVAADRNHAQYTIKLATDLGLFTPQDGDLLSLDPDLINPNAFRVACLRTLATPPVGEELAASNNGTQRSAVFLSWLVRQDPAAPLTNDEIATNFVTAVPAMAAVTNSTQINSLKRWAIWCGVAEPTDVDSSIRPLPIRAILACLRTPAIAIGEAVEVGNFAETLFRELPCLPEGEFGVAMADLLHAPHLAAQTFSRGSSRALLAIERYGAIRLDSADDADAGALPWNLDVTQGLQKPVTRVEVAAA